VASCITSAALAQDASMTADLSALRAKYGKALADRVANEFHAYATQDSGAGVEQ